MIHFGIMARYQYQWYVSYLSHILPGDKTQSPLWHHLILQQAEQTCKKREKMSLTGLGTDIDWKLVVFLSNYSFLVHNGAFMRQKSMWQIDAYTSGRLRPHTASSARGRQCAAGCWFPAVWKVPALLLSRSAAATPLSSSYANSAPTTPSAASIVPGSTLGFFLLCLFFLPWKASVK